MRHTVKMSAQSSYLKYVDIVKTVNVKSNSDYGNYLVLNISASKHFSEISKTMEFFQDVTQ